MKVRILIGIVLIFSSVSKLFSGEGMWIPLLLDSLNHDQMQEKGLRLSAEEIYSINGSSLKDAVVLFGGGCTGEVISPEGLLITNHHCGYSRISAHSTLEHNYLANGFWAASKSEELPNPGLTVTFLVRMENVTDRVLEGIGDSITEEERNQRTGMNMLSIKKDVTMNTHYQAEIKPLFFGKEYYLFVYEIFRDVRLVGAPPESIGNFGGDTDNWVWPRHTGDFSLFRIYAGKDNKPAEYAPDNIPYTPKKYLKISVKGVSEGDFTMVMGYPAHTDQFLTADALDLISGKSLPAKIEMRTARLNTMQKIMERSPQDKLLYASKHKSISNSWKKWIGVTRGIERANIIAEKRKQEEEFSKWASQLDSNTTYANLPGDFSNLYKSYAPLYLANDLATEFFNAIESASIINHLQIKFFESADSSEDYRKKLRDVLHAMGRNFFRSSAVEIDRAVLPVLLKTYADYSPPEWHPAFYHTIKESYNGDYDAYVSYIFATSLFTDSLRFHKTIRLKDQKLRNKIVNDPMITLYRDFSMMIYNGEFEKLSTMEIELKRLYRQYVSGLMEMQPSRQFYPDANFTLRVTYGEASSYKPSDAVHYEYYTTLDGVIEKENPEIPDYRVPERLKELYSNHDFGPYTIDGSVPTCFIASNHTSGGNSGSPVIDADGYLIGINFDRNWEGTLSDYAYDPEVCRNISLDIRYVLFIIDKFADADWLLNELTIVNN